MEVLGKMGLYSCLADPVGETSCEVIFIGGLSFLWSISLSGLHLSSTFVCMRYALDVSFLIGNLPSAAPRVLITGEANNLLGLNTPYPICGF